jgi:hypothetical protein
MIYVVYSVFNDMPVIRDSIASIEQLADRIIAIDGRYKDFPGEQTFSDDGTEEYLMSHKKTLYVPCGGADEITKRNLYLRFVDSMAKPGDFIFHLDGDEVLEGWIDLREMDDADVGIIFNKRTDGGEYHRARLFRWQPGLYYADKHYWIHDAQGDTFCILRKAGAKYREVNLTNCMIDHRNNARNAEREQAKEKYYSKVRARENPITEVL